MTLNSNEKKNILTLLKTGDDKIGRILSIMNGVHSCSLFGVLQVSVIVVSLVSDLAGNPEDRFLNNFVLFWYVSTYNSL